MSPRLSVVLTFALPLCALVCPGCDGERSGDAPAKAANVAKEAPEGAAQARPKDAGPEDKGSAKLVLGEEGEVWEAKWARARFKEGGKLRISASVQTQEGETIGRRQLTLFIQEFKGPGRYELNNAISNLISVKLGVGAVKEAARGGDEAKLDRAATKAATKGLSGGAVLSLRGAKVEITRVTDDFVDGTISWSGDSPRGPNKLSGEFHARIKKS